MKNKNTLACLTALLMPQWAGAATADVTIEGVVTAPTCTLTAPLTHNIGSMEVGKPFDAPRLTIGVDCGSHSVASKLYATVISGTMMSDILVYMDGAGSVASAAPPILTLIYLGGRRNVILDGSGATNDLNTFCVGTTTRTCILEPAGSVPENATPGSAKVSLRFTLRYT
ncbi:hypothetical protein C3433_23280 [Citrobacter freundii]|nr:hypothetical protein [Salmonella enterica]EIT1624846.1 hypothetical protein [Salmonella enterica]POT24391.1 hypothetical protein C3433_23280 [Citrobacter freundii]